MEEGGYCEKPTEIYWPFSSKTPIDTTSIWLLLLLLLSCFSRVQLCAIPETAAHQAPPSPGFSRQEHWSGLPFPSPMHESEKWKWSSFSCIRLFATPWTAAHQAPPSTASLWHHNGDKVIYFTENSIEPNEQSRELSRSWNVELLLTKFSYSHYPDICHDSLQTFYVIFTIWYKTTSKTCVFVLVKAFKLYGNPGNRMWITLQ